MLIIEKDIEGYLKKRVEDCGGKCLKFLTNYERGMPDRLVVIPGNRIIFVETKRPEGGKLSEVQKYQIQKLRDMGCKVYVANTKEEVDQILYELGVRDAKQTKENKMDT